MMAITSARFEQIRDLCNAPYRIECIIEMAEVRRGSSEEVRILREVLRAAWVAVELIPRVDLEEYRAEVVRRDGMPN